jgi:hypothetical protein
MYLVYVVCTRVWNILCVHVYSVLNVFCVSRVVCRVYVCGV